MTGTIHQHRRHVQVDWNMGTRDIDYTIGDYDLIHNDIDDIKQRIKNNIQTRFPEYPNYLKRNIVKMFMKQFKQDRKNLKKKYKTVDNNMEEFDKKYNQNLVDWRKSQNNHTNALCFVMAFGTSLSILNFSFIPITLSSIAVIGIYLRSLDSNKKYYEYGVGLVNDKINELKGETK